jgi:uncharacterized membrane protein
VQKTSFRRFASKNKMMRTLFLGLHIIAGSAALISGMIAILAGKKRGIHTSSGITYYYAMLLTAISAVVLATMRWNPFLLSIGIFSFYMVHGGRMAMIHFRRKTPYSPQLHDRLIPIAGLLTAIVMVLFPVWQHYSYFSSLSPVLPVFGGILLGFAIRDLRITANPKNYTPHNKLWLRMHIAGMGGGYISTVTAFLVVNITFSPAWVVWLAPTVVGSVLISLAIRKTHSSRTT